MLDQSPLPRRAFLAGSLAAASALALPGCATSQTYSLTEAIRRLLVLSSERAFVRLTEPGGFWDQQVGQAGLERYFGNRGNVLSNILTSALFKSRLEGVVADAAIDASYRAAPVVAEAVRTLGYANTLDLIRGGPTAVPEIGEALRVAQDPLVSQLIAGLTGVDLGGVAGAFANQVDEVIWGEIAQEEAAIRADPGSTRDPVLIGIFGRPS
jgi:hypothetical protein